ncbi:MAG: ABC transporter permease [Steroidobacteraceae bacterium]
MHAVEDFVGVRVAYYERVFRRIQESSTFVWSFNFAAAALGPLWAGARGLWGFFALAAFGELVALTVLARGLYGNLGAAGAARAAKLAAVSAVRASDAAAALQAGNAVSAETFGRISENLAKAAQVALNEAHHAAASAPALVVAGCALLAVVKLAEGVFANAAYERRYTAWRTNRSVSVGIAPPNVLLAVLLVAAMYPMTLYRFTATHVPESLTRVPVDRRWFSAIAAWIDGAFDLAYRIGSGGFDGIRDALRAVVRVLEMLLLGTPWPVVMTVLVAIAWRLAGRRVGLLTAAAIAYLAVLGLWELSMQTVALLGTAAIICVALGIPLGIWLSKSARASALARPVLDLMQTMPALVYLIPAIAFFGTGTPPGIIATLIFGLPPVVRLTTLGLQQVPADIKEAARAYGATPRQLLFGVELPLARPAIMAGVNQTILMCLSMVVIAALIGAQGLGTVVLEALQYAATGQGVLAGIAILLCAIVIDRVVQAAFESNRR